MGGRPGCWRGGITAQSQMNHGPWSHGDKLRHVAATALGLQWPQNKGLLPTPGAGGHRGALMQVPGVCPSMARGGGPLRTCLGSGPRVAPTPTSRQSQVLWPVLPSRGGRSSGGHWALPAHTSRGSLHPHRAGQCGRPWSLSPVLGLGHRAQGSDQGPGVCTFRRRADPETRPSSGPTPSGTLLPSAAI